MEQILKDSLKSISIENLEEVFEMLFNMMKANGLQEPARGFNSEDLKNFLRKNAIFVPSLWKTLFSVNAPDYVITYMWLATTLRELLQILKELLRSRTGRVWIDVVFNDQRSDQVSHAIARAWGRGGGGPGEAARPCGMGLICSFRWRDDPPQYNRRD